jgi:hypothetical protein
LLESFWRDTTPAFEGLVNALPAKADVVLEAGAVATEASGCNGDHVNNGLAVDYASVAARVDAERPASTGCLLSPPFGVQ